MGDLLDHPASPEAQRRAEQRRALRRLDWQSAIFSAVAIALLLFGWWWAGGLVGPA